MQTQQHPFYPQNLNIPNYVRNELSDVEILSRFFVAVVGVSIVTWLFASTRPRLNLSDRLSCIWFAVCAGIHTILELYYTLNASRLPSDMSFLGQVWKEYALSDSRYLTIDPAVWSIEAVTSMIEGPACFVLVYGILFSKPYRHSLQLCISLGQLYGCVLYYMTSWLDGFKDSHPHPQYFLGYFVGMNLPWIVVPCLMCWSSVSAINSAFRRTAHVANKRSSLDNVEIYTALKEE